MFSQQRLWHAIFNASNMNGLAAVLLSISLGAWPGTLIFLSATLIGIYNKYTALSATSHTHTKNRLARELSSPSLTAKILMGAAFMNCVDSAVKIFIGDPTLWTHHLYTAFAWGFGVLGDDALRKNDDTNFANLFKKKEASPLWTAYQSATRNPSFYYLAVNIFMGLSLLTKNATTPDPMSMLLNASVIGLSLIGMGYGLRQSWRAANGDIPPEKINDGWVNYLNTGTNLGMGSLAAWNHIWPVAAAQLFFGISNIRALFETRSALKKELA